MRAKRSPALDAEVRERLMEALNIGELLVDALEWLEDQRPKAVVTDAGQRVAERERKRLSDLRNLASRQQEPDLRLTQEEAQKLVDFYFSGTAESRWAIDPILLRLDKLIVPQPEPQQEGRGELRDALQRIEERLDSAKTGSPAAKVSECLSIARAALDLQGEETE